MGDMMRGHASHRHGSSTQSVCNKRKNLWWQAPRWQCGSYQDEHQMRALDERARESSSWLQQSVCNKRKKKRVHDAAWWQAPRWQCGSYCLTKRTVQLANCQPTPGRQLLFAMFLFVRVANHILVLLAVLPLRTIHPPLYNLLQDGSVVLTRIAPKLVVIIGSFFA